FPLQPEFPLQPARTDEPAQPNPSSFHTARTAPTFLNFQKNQALMLRAGGPGPRTTFLLPLPPPGLGRRAPPRPTVERTGSCSPVVFNDIKHLTATRDRRARFRHPVTPRGSSHAPLPWALPRERATRIYATLSMT